MQQKVLYKIVKRFLKLTFVVTKARKKPLWATPKHFFMKILLLNLKSKIYKNKTKKVINLI
jgi:hypothetical protein